MAEGDHIKPEDWRTMTSQEQLDYVRTLEKSDHELRRLLALVECPDHGPCIPFLRQWIIERRDTTQPGNAN